MKLKRRKYQISKFGKEIRKHLQDNMLTLADIAKELNISRTQLYNIETGKSRIKDKYLEKIFKFMNLSFYEQVKLKKMANVLGCHTDES